MDTLNKQERSERMGQVHSKNTKPELKVRKIIYKLGYRYRLHDKKLPGKPDIVFKSRRKLIFVHGCFWHRHPDPSCALARLPKSRHNFWIPKLNENRERDLRNEEQLKKDGWRVLEIWECQIQKEDALIKKIEEFLEK